LADRMACLKGGVVANVVVPTPDYVRLAGHYPLTELRHA
ncbi:transposase domain protein, partial [Mycobacterium intracellulare MIN_052511_1280]